MRINQLLMHEEKTGKGHFSLGGGKNDDAAFFQSIVGQAAGEVDGLVQKKLEENGLAEGGDMEAGAANGMYSGFQKDYGAIGPCTFGYCESPNQWGEPKMDSRFGEVVVRHGFADTQWMRFHSTTWARDEPYFQNMQGIRGTPPSLIDES